MCDYECVDIVRDVGARKATDRRGIKLEQAAMGGMKGEIGIEKQARRTYRMLTLTDKKMAHGNDNKRRSHYRPLLHT